tara:strand:+ start:112 stop:507 length:396 start_codon:yes stop_codon:yes gene_type:complete
MIESELSRIANALEAIAQALNPGFVVSVDGVESVPTAPTLTNPPLAWFASALASANAVSEASGDAAWIQQLAAEEVKTAQANFDWLNVVPGKVGRRPNNPGSCSRCGREGRRKLNHCDHCSECKHEGWWDE